MTRRYLAIGALVALLVALGVLVGCVQPVDAGATAEETFDLTIPDTPVISDAVAAGHQVNTPEGPIVYYNASTLPPSLDFGITPGAPGRYRLDGEAWIGPSLSLSGFDPSSLGDGSYRLELQERDASGNWSETYLYRFVVDTQPPSPPTASPTTVTSTANLTPTFYWFGDRDTGNRYFEANVTGPGVTQSYTFDFRDAAPGSEFSASPATFTGSGTITCSIRERDLAENWSTYTDISMTIDVAGPIFTSQPPTPSNQTSNSWSWQSSGAANADRHYEYELRSFPLPGTLIESGSRNGSPVSFSNEYVSDGTYQLLVRESRNDVTDWSLWVESDPVTVDTMPPGAPTAVTSSALTGTSPNRYVTTANTTFSWSSGGGGSGVYRYSLDGGSSWSTWASGSSRTISTPRGAHSLLVQERDAAGNVSPASAPVDFLAQPLFLSQIDLYMNVGAGSTGNVVVRVLRSGILLGSRTLDTVALRSVFDWITFTFGNIPVLPGETIEIASIRMNPQDNNTNDYTGWRCSTSDTYPYGAGVDPYDFSFQTYVRTTPGGTAALDQDHFSNDYGYRLDSTSPWTQTVQIQAP